MIKRRIQPRRMLPAVLLIFLVRPGFSVEVIYEIEPNNTPAEATEIAGTTTLIGSLQGQDQDGYKWLVSDVDARKRWTLELRGIPGRLTIVDVLRVEYAENGTDVVGVEKLFTVGSRDGTRPGLAENLLFEPGEYILGVAHSGDGGTSRPPMDSVSFTEEEADAEGEQPEPPGGYRLHIREGHYFVVRPNPVENDSREKAQVVSPGAAFAAFTVSDNSWFRIPVNEAQAVNYWDFSGQVPVGRQGTVFLRGEQGEQRALAQFDALGKFSMRDLGLDPGEYFVEYQGNAGNAIRFFGSTPVGQVAQGREAEPNGNWNQANRIQGGAVEGRLAAPGDADFFRLLVDEEHSNVVTRLSSETAGSQRVDFCLLDGIGQRVQCRNGNGTLELPDLVLSPGEWGVSVHGAADTDYKVTFDIQGEIEAGSEAEPNDAVEYASSVPAKNRITGRFTGADTDFYRIVITDEAQFWRFQAVGDGITNLRFYDGSGIQNQQVTATAGQQIVRMENVLLLPGQHFVSVSGQGGGEYTLLALPRPRPDPNIEREPNDTVTQAQSLAIGQTRTGLLLEGDKDHYRFHLANWDRIRLTVNPPVDAKFGAGVYWDVAGGWRSASNAEPGAPIVMEGLFQPGDFYLGLYPLEASEAEYTVTLERLPRFGCATDCEPNDNPVFASPVPASQIIEGRVGEWDDWDYYRLPVFDSDTELVIRPTEIQHIEVSLELYGENLMTWDGVENVHRGVIPAGETSYLMIRPSGNLEYRLSLSYSGNDPPGMPDGPLPIEAQLVLETPEVAAYRKYGQQVDGRLELLNRGTDPLELDLESATSDLRWQVIASENSITLDPGEQREVPVGVLVPDDAWADRPVRISLAARAADGRHIEAFQDIEVVDDARPVQPRRHWDLPDELVGGLNVAFDKLGGRWVGEPDGNTGWPEKLIDGIAVDGDGLAMRGGHAGEVVYELAGDAPVEIAGVAVNLLFGPANTMLADLELHTSVDGQQFEQAVVRPLDPVKTEQAFVLQQPVLAKFVKLIVGRNFDSRLGSAIGELKVIAMPGYDLSGGKGFNLAAPELGGHVVWANISDGREILTEETENLAVNLAKGQSLEWVVGFHHARAARISRLEWVYPPGEARFQKLAKVLVSISIDSPIGPWVPLGEREIDPEAAEQVWKLEEDVWARYVRFAAAGPEAPTTMHPPETLRIWEVPTDQEYRSILTEWGFASQAAIYEYLSDIEAEPPLRISDNVSRELAAELDLDQRVAGTVQLGEIVNWYRLALPAEHNTLVIKLGGESTVRTVVQVEDETGEQIQTRIRHSDSTPARQTIEAIVEAGSVLFVEVSEPPRNVAFLWDTSPSVAPFVPLIYNAMITYAGDLVPGRDAANFAPYGSRVLLRDWYGEPYILQTVLNEYPRNESSSAAEYTMELASRELGKRAGTRAIINVTDAATGRHIPAWDQFAEVKPRIFNLGVSSAGNLGRDPPSEQDRMQDWSRVNGGHYQYMLSQGEMEVAFDRAATMLRRPADYTLRATSEFREAPGPGTLRVVAGGGGTPSAASGGVELILDASGSMLKRLDGKRRIAIAREVLSDAVRDTIPAGTPVALRVFGHKEPNACRTDLEIPLGPLDPDATVNVIEGINAMNLAKTPIAASLAAAEQDLGSGDGKKVIVLLTDGEETCDGDPEQVIRTLQEKGLDVSVNIVGFAIDDDELERQFENWSRNGNGRYFSARDQAGLGEAITESLQTPYVVYDQAGDQVASGIVGGKAVKLEAGFYRVSVATSPQKEFTDVEVPAELDVEVNLEH